MIVRENEPIKDVQTCVNWGCRDGRTSKRLRAGIGGWEELVSAENDGRLGFMSMGDCERKSADKGGPNVRELVM